MQLSNERMRHTAEGAEFLEKGECDGEEGGRGRPLHRDLSTALEREEYGKVRLRNSQEIQICGWNLLTIE